MNDQETKTCHFRRNRSKTKFLTHTHTSTPDPQSTRSTQSTRSSPTHRSDVLALVLGVVELKRRNRRRDSGSGLQATVQVNSSYRPQTLHSLTAANRRTIINGKVMTGRKVHGDKFRIGTAFELGPAGTAHDQVPKIRRPQ